MESTAKFEFREINCPVCGASDAKFVGCRGGDAHQSGLGVESTIVRCASCSHQYPNPMPFPKGGLDEIYVDADDYFSGHDIEFKKSSGLSLMKMFEAKLGRKGKFLDVGCGVGELLWAAQTLGWEAEGIDPSPDFIEAGRQKLGVNGKVGTLDTVHYADNEFDAIALGGIIEHLYDPVSTLREVSRILKPNGWFWFDCPNEDGLYMKFGNFYMRLRGRKSVVVLAPTFSPFHVQGFNPKSLKKILTITGFEASEVKMFGSISKQTGDQTLTKMIEYWCASLINGFDKFTGGGVYMEVWARKKEGKQ